LITNKTIFVFGKLRVRKVYESPSSPDVVGTQVVVDTNIDLATVILMLVVDLSVGDLVVNWCWDMTGDLGEEQLLVDEVE
tara:strand:+ start:1402 stop:1641 length:240 start_codon:yes stop_codon:yes gene_type:complete